MKEITTDRVVIVGAGLGALYAALKLVPRPVLMISPEVLGGRRQFGLGTGRTGGSDGR